MERKRSPFRWLKSLVSFLDARWEEIAIVFLCSTLVLSLTFIVLVRYILHISFLSTLSHWAEELASFSFIWLLYWGASLATKKAGHFRVSAQFNFLPERMRKYALLPGDIVWLLFNVLIVKLGIDLYRSSTEKSLSMEIPMKYVYAIIPLSFSFIVFRLVQYHWKAWKGRTPGEEETRNG